MDVVPEKLHIRLVSGSLIISRKKRKESDVARNKPISTERTLITTSGWQSPVRKGI